MKKQLLLLSAVAVLVILELVQPNGSNKEQVARVGFQAPKIELQGLDGTSYSSADLLGKPALINFWASWCGPCRKEAPDLVRLYDKYKDKIEFYAVNLTSDDSVSGAAAFVKEYQLPFPVLLDEKGTVSQLYRVKTIPTTFFVDAKGTILNINLGLVSPDSLEQMIIRTIGASKGGV